MKQRGFSLVELSIVLVILGLLVGGILAGQSLIRASELRSVVTDVDRYRAAVLTFRDKYFAVPGDMSNATQFWGTAASGSTCRDTDSRTLPDPRNTCDGNGNGALNNTASYTNEFFRFWQHLANAGLIGGMYSGAEGPGGNRDATIGVNVPALRIQQGGMSIEGKGTYDNTSIYYWPGPALNTLFVGKKSSSGIINTEGAIFKPEEAWNLDRKLDDGRPATGKVMSQKNMSNCHTTQDENTSEYDISSTLIKCQMLLYNFTNN